MTQPIRQTISYIKNILAIYAIDPKNKLGQNFLIDLNTLDLVIAAGNLSKQDAVLEIGPGTGTLTHNLVEQAGYVLSVEIDSRFEPILKELVPSESPFELHMGDFLASKNRLDSQVLDKLKAGAKKYGCTQFKLVANLPYSIATPAIINLLMSDIPFERLVGMVQFETAEKIAAKPNTDPYSAMSVLIQSLAECRILRRVPPTVFHPKPKVDSAILEILPNPDKRAHLCNFLSTADSPMAGPNRFRIFLRDLFLHRRKSLRQALAKMPMGTNILKPLLDELLITQQLTPEIRADQLDAHQLLTLAKGWWRIKDHVDPIKGFIEDSLLDEA